MIEIDAEAVIERLSARLGRLAAEIEKRDVLIERLQGRVRELEATPGASAPNGRLAANAR